MSLTPEDPNFDAQAEAYFEWSWHGEGKEVWDKLDRQALSPAVSDAIHLLKKCGRQTPRCLDIGTGAGKVIGLLRDCGIPDKDIFGGDISQKMLDLVSQMFPDVFLFNLNIGEPALAVEKLGRKKPFDIVTGSMVLNHLNDAELRSAIGDLYQLLNDGGFFIGIIPFRHNIHSQLEDSDQGKYRIEPTHWGTEIVYHHVPWGALSEYFLSAGFYPHIQVVRKSSTDTSFLDWKRTLIVAQKSASFSQKGSLDLSTLPWTAFYEDGQLGLTQSTEVNSE